MRRNFTEEYFNSFKIRSNFISHPFPHSLTDSLTQRYPQDVRMIPPEVRDYQEARGKEGEE